MNIRRILDSTKPLDIFDFPIWKDQYQSWIKAVHPDKNPDPKAREAFERLIAYKEILENGFQFEDELCKIRQQGRVLTFEGPFDKLELSLKNYQRILSIPDLPKHFPLYFPEKMEMSGDKLKVYLREDSHFLSELTLEEKHVKWCFNRMLEFSTMLNLNAGFTHCGINPMSVLVCPKTHGIQVVSFYHTVQIHDKLKSVIGLHPYKSWYPTEIFTTKVSNPLIDQLLSKRTAIYLLGDKSGVGTKLRGSIEDGLLDNLITQQSTIQESYIKYKQYIESQPKIFHELKL